MVRRGVVRCRHRWRKVGPAPDSNGEKCDLWRCDTCDKEWEVFWHSKPGTGGGAVLVDG
jgi:hypothetical protein